MRLIDAEALQEQMRHIVGLFGDKYRSVRLAIDAAPTIEPAAPDRVLASDVVGKIRVYNDKGDLEFRTCESLSPPSEYICIAESETTAVATILALPCEMVADMLQGCLERGERVDWPDGSPGCRFRKAEPEEPKKPSDDYGNRTYADIKPGVFFRNSDLNWKIVNGVPCDEFTLVHLQIEDTGYPVAVIPAKYVLAMMNDAYDRVGGIKEPPTLLEVADAAVSEIKCYGITSDRGVAAFKVLADTIEREKAKQGDK